MRLGIDHLGFTHPIVRSAKKSLVVSRIELGKIQEAEETTKELIQWEESNNKQETFDSLGLKETLGDIFIDQGRYQDCEELIERVIRGRKGVSLIEDPALFGLADRLALAKRRIGKLEYAESLQMTLFVGKAKTFGRISNPVSSSLEQLMFIMSQQGNHTEAEVYGELAFHVKTSLSSQSDESLLELATNLAAIKAENGKYSEAERMLEQVVLDREKGVSDLFPKQSEALSELAEVKHELRKYLEAKALLERSMNLEKEIWADDSPFDADRECCQCEIDCIQQATVTPRHITRRRQNPGRRLETLERLIKTEESLGNFENAERLQKDVLSRRESVGWIQCQHYVRDILGFAELYRESGAYDISEACCQRAIVEAKRIFGEYHHDFEARTALAMTKFVRGQLNEAEAIHEQILQINRHTAVRDDREYGAALINLTFIKIRVGKWKACVNLVLELSHVHDYNWLHRFNDLVPILRPGEKTFFNLCLRECLRAIGISEDENQTPSAGD